ncbi:MAG TPA: hypothetical protein DEP65_01205 [Ruminococcus sp.]|nr:hypothetical protein [Ruminococcus sp.]
MIKIKELRQSIGITQEQLAEQLNVGQSTVAMWERGINMPRSDKLPELAKVLKCEVSDLF